MLLTLAAATMLLTALTHSIFGEKLLIGPILAFDVGVTKSSLARRVLRFAWHFTRAFSSKVGTGLVQKMRQTKSLERFT